MNELMTTAQTAEIAESADTFTNDLFGEIRVLTEDDNTVLFCALDVATSLGYKIQRKAISDHCRYVLKRNVPHPQSPDKTIEMSFIPESDVYRLVFSSKLPNAEKFTDWITKEVIPSVLRKGYYITAGSDKNEIITRETMMLQQKVAELTGENRILKELTANHRQMTDTLALAVEGIKALDFELSQSVPIPCEADEPYSEPRLLDKPKIRDFAMSQVHKGFRMYTIDQLYDAWIAAKLKFTFTKGRKGTEGLVSVSEIAMDYGMNAKQFNKLLADAGFQSYDKERSCWLPDPRRYGTEDQGIMYKILAYQNGPKIGYTTYWTELGWRNIYGMLRYAPHNLYPDSWLDTITPFIYPLIGQKYRYVDPIFMFDPEDDEEPDPPEYDWKPVPRKSVIKSE
jgi:prophage antirepressor-like protein